MLRLALFLIAVFVGSAVADAKYKRPAVTSPSTPELVAAEKAWATAFAEKDSAKAVLLWEAAAVAFDKAVAGAGKLKTDTAYTAILAWKNSMSLNDARPKAPPPDAKPGPLTDRDKALIKSLDVYIALDPANEETIGMLFLKGNIFRRHDMFDEANTIFESIVTKNPEHETAEYAATLLLDTLNRQAKFDKLVEWATKMRGMPKLLAKREDLVAVLDTIHVQAQRKQAEALEGKQDFAGCGTAYRDLATSMKKADRRDELFFNAGVCFEKAGNDADAAKAFFQAAGLKTSLAQRAKARAQHAARNAKKSTSAP